MRDEEEDTRTYQVVVNHEEQYSIWFADRDLPLGWRKGGRVGPKAECLAYIKEVWTDMRPLSLRARMEEDAKIPPAPQPPPGPAAPHRPVNELVERLSTSQEVEAGLRPERTVAILKEAIDRGYVHMKFVKTGTELGIRLDAPACDLARADFAAGKGTVRLVGDLTLNYNKVRYHGELDLETLKGSGRLEWLAEVRPGSGGEGGATSPPGRRGEGGATSPPRTA
jgi:uncharacterized protein YbdZ (MbtH family)